MSDNNYTVERKDMEIGPFKRPTPTPKQVKTEKPLATGKNFTVETTNPSAFSFSISHDLLNFGKLTATNPVIRLIYLTTSSRTPYYILAAQNSQLKEGDKIIPDTTCDNGSCSQDTYASWVSALTYGFGYQTSNMPIDSYKQFSDLSKNEAPEVIFSHNSANNLQDDITYKVNVSSTQQTGKYSNSVIYVAIPSF